MQLADRTALITGAAAGIGRGIAVSLAQRRCNLILTDIDESGLSATAALVEPHGVRVSCYKLDVSSADEIADFPRTIEPTWKGLDILVNNAGVAVTGNFDQVSEADFEWLFDINFWGVVRMTRAFLPMLRRSSDARIVNLSSIFGIVAPAGEVPYTASKFAVRGFSEGLRHELIDTSIGVTVVHPGGVATGIGRNARHYASISEQEIDERNRITERLLTLSPDVAGEKIVRGIEQRRDRVLVGTDAVAVVWLQRLFPITYWKKMRRFM